MLIHTITLQKTTAMRAASTEKLADATSVCSVASQGNSRRVVANRGTLLLSQATYCNTDIA